MTSEQIQGGAIKIGGVKYDLVQIVHATGLIWPTSATTYVIDSSTLVIHYSSNADYIYADNSNYCYATADVDVYRGEQKISTLTDVTLTPSSLSGTYASNFRIDGNNVKAYNLGTTPVNLGTAANPSGYYCTASFVYNNSESVSGTVNQQWNTYTYGTPIKTYTGYDIELSSYNLTYDGGRVNVIGTAVYSRTQVLVWTSHAESYGETTTGLTEQKNPEVLSVFPSQTIAADNTYIDFSNNTETTAKTYSVSAYYEGFNSSTKTVTVAAYEVYTYYNLSIIAYYYQSIPASGGDVRPTLTFSVQYKLNDEYQGTMTGEFTNGATYTTATCTETGHTATVYCSYYYKSGNSYYSDTNNGLVHADSLGTTERENYTELGTRMVSLLIGTAEQDSQDVIVYQERNRKTLVATTYGEKTYGQQYTETNYRNISVTVSSSDYTDRRSPCFAGGGTATIATSKSGQYRSIDYKDWERDVTYDYLFDSGAHDYDSDTETGRDEVPGTDTGWVDFSDSPTITITGEGFSVSGSTVTIADRKDVVGGERLGIVTATYHGETSSITLYQQENSLGQETYITYSAWTEDGESYSGRYRVTDFTLSTEYTDVNHRAPSTGCTVTYSVSAAHSILMDYKRDKYTDRRYTSWSSAHDDDEHRYRVTTIESETRVLTEEVTGDAYVVSSVDNWITVDSANSSLIVSPNTDSNYRFTTVSARNANGGSYWAKNFYQNAYGSLTADKDRLYFLAIGGSVVVKVTAVATDWSISYSTVAAQPVLTISPATGTSGETDVTVTCEPTEYMTRDGTITISATNRDDIPDVTILVQQSEPEPESPDL